MWLRGEVERNVPYYQTNPPILDKKMAVIRRSQNSLCNKSLPGAVGSFKENEPTGEGVKRCPPSPGGRRDAPRKLSGLEAEANGEI